MKRVLLGQYAVTALQFYNYSKLAGNLSPGTHLELTREPMNPHDARAVAVSLNGSQIGYIPKANNSTLSRLLDEGVFIESHVSRHALEKGLGERLLLSLYFRCGIGGNVLPRSLSDECLGRNTRAVEDEGELEPGEYAGHIVEAYGSDGELTVVYQLERKNSRCR